MFKAILTIDGEKEPIISESDSKIERTIFHGTGRWHTDVRAFQSEDWVEVHRRDEDEARRAALKWR